MDRYSRHTSLSWFGSRGQEKLRQSSVLVIGCGGTGCVCSSFLARAGVGRLRILDRDVAGITDLHRQILFDETDVERVRLKARVAAERLREQNPEIQVEALVAEFNPQTAETLIAEVDLIVECSDNFETRMLLNEVCTKCSKPWIHGACVSTAGMVIPFPVTRIACFRCVVDRIPDPKAAPTCEQVGILGPVAGTVGCIQAAEAITMLIRPQSSQQKIIYLDSLSSAYQTIEVRRKDDCPVCGRQTYEFLEGRRRWSGYRICGGDTLHLNLGRPVDLGEIRGSISGCGHLKDLGGMLRIEAEGKIVLIFADGRAIIKGTSSVAEGRELVSRLLRR